MRIGVDATCWANRRGYGRFTRALLAAVLELDHWNEYLFFVDSDSAKLGLPDNIQIARVGAEVPTVRAAAANGRRSLHDLWATSRAISRRALDLIFFPSVYSYVPLSSRVPQLVTIHDAIPEMFPELVFPTWRSKLFWRAKSKLGCAQAHLVLTVSEYSRRCLVEKLNIARTRMRVVNEASDPCFRPLENPDGRSLYARWRLPASARLLVYVGGFSPHKNLGLLVDVFRELQQQPQFSDLHLMLVGDYEGDVFHSCYRQMVEQVRQSGLQERVRFTGHMGDDDLVVLLNLAGALALPSFSEGFGLPAVEAAACGAPVVATTRSPLPELLGEGVLAVDPEDRPGWRDAIGRVLSDAALRHRMRAAGMAAARRLSWQNSARQLLSIFEEVQQSRVAPA